MKVENMISRRSGRAVINQFIINNGNYSAFQSYNSLICEFINQKSLGYDAVLRVSKKYNYSRTTSKYFKQFIEEAGIDVKACLKALKDDRLYFESYTKDIALVLLDEL